MMDLMITKNAGLVESGLHDLLQILRSLRVI
jgi:hypothetical protein